jgi:hypothetical protein
VVDRHSADPPRPRPRPEWTPRTTVRTRTALAATSRGKPLFPDRLQALAVDEAWRQVAESVGGHAASVIEAGDYPFADFYEEDPAAIDLVASHVFTAVRGELPRGEVLLDPLYQLKPPMRDVEELIGELINHRLTASAADRAGRLLAAPTARFDLVAWAWRIRMAPIGKRDNDLLAFSDAEISYFVSRRHGSVVVDKSSSSTGRRVVGSFSSEPDAMRFLVLLIGLDWRSTRRVLMGQDLAAGMTVEDGPTATHLSWLDGWAEFPSSIGGQGDALAFSHVVGQSFEQIAVIAAQ